MLHIIIITKIIFLFVATNIVFHIYPAHTYRAFCMVVAAGFLVIIGFVIGTSSPYNLVSLGGAVVLITLGFIFSANPGMVRINMLIVYINMLHFEVL